MLLSTNSISLRKHWIKCLISWQFMIILFIDVTTIEMSIIDTLDTYEYSLKEYSYSLYVYSFHFHKNRLNPLVRCEHSVTCSAFSLTTLAFSIVDNPVESVNNSLYSIIMSALMSTICKSIYTFLILVFCKIYVLFTKEYSTSYRTYIRY